MRCKLELKENIIEQSMTFNYLGIKICREGILREDIK